MAGSCTVWGFLAFPKVGKIHMPCDCISRYNIPKQRVHCWWAVKLVGSCLEDLAFWALMIRTMLHQMFTFCMYIWIEHNPNLVWVLPGYLSSEVLLQIIYCHGCLHLMPLNLLILIWLANPSQRHIMSNLFTPNLYPNLYSNYSNFLGGGGC